MIPPTMRDRARDIVKRAAAQTKTPFLKSWLFDDPEGTWELRAYEKLCQAQETINRGGMQAEWPDERVDAAVADELCIMGLTALIERERKKTKKK